MEWYRPKPCVFALLLFLISLFVTAHYISTKSELRTTFKLISKQRFNKTGKLSRKHRIPKVRKIILLWDHPFGDSRSGPIEGKEIKAGLCKLTYDRRQLHKADAVVFHDKIAPTSWPYPRLPHQRFVWWTQESPWTVRWVENLNLKVYDNGFFNWTMTYKRDADIYTPYFNSVKFQSGVAKGKDVVDKLLKEKTRVVAWFVSNCGDTSGAKKRMSYFKEMLQVLPQVDSFGRCFNNQDQLPRSKTNEFVRKEKFYLSFENSLHCKDYITEKFFTTCLLNGVVPVVWGPKKEDVLAIAPPNSFIHTEDFQSAKELANYLMYLDRNMTAYRAYFEWREDEKVTQEELMKHVERENPGVKTILKRSIAFASLCEKLLTDNKTKIKKSLRNEFFNKEPPECLYNYSLPQKK